jgi:light-regulated signal transduction histidine kinase (bacteriophytochrome)
MKTWPTSSDWSSRAKPAQSAVRHAHKPMDAEESAMEKFFEPFFRGDVRDSRQVLGLGLHIASPIAQAS